MNIQNIISMAKVLEGLGFDAVIGNQILKRVSFRPVEFTIHQQKLQGKDVINFQLFFEKNRSENYSCVYYEAILRKEIEIPEAAIETIDVSELENRMATINWVSFLSIEQDKSFQKDDIHNWKKEETVESIVSDLMLLDSVVEGKECAFRLKMKYWCDTPVQEMIANVNLLRSKFEISQRFYLLEGQGGISTEESYRYLNNRWLEKQLQAKRKQMDEVGKNEEIACSCNCS